MGIRSFLDRLLFLIRRLPAGNTRRSLEITLRGLPQGHPVGCRAERINKIASLLKTPKDYLEIGVQYGFTLSSVNLRNKTGVDPQLMFNPRLAQGVKLHKETSDVFFSKLGQEVRFDVIFLDGLHTFEQTSRDFVNALRHLKPGGVIIIDDVVPSSREKALPSREESIRRQLQVSGAADGEWFGDVWKVPVAVHDLYPGLLDVTVLGSGVCGQAIVRQVGDISLAQDIGIEAFTRYENLTFDDYFLPSGEILLPNWAMGESLRRIS